jgi:hypothetical protein
MKRTLLLALTAALSSCVTPYQPPPPATGSSLDRPASGERSNRNTRYLEETQADSVATTPADPNATAQVQSPEPTTPPPPADPHATPPASTGTTPPPDAGATVTAPPTPPPSAELPFGKPVPGKKGFVYSPYDGTAGFVDVRDIAPGTKVKCPYTGKVFRVP